MSTIAEAKFDLECPRLWRDLQIIRQESPDGVVYLVHDPHAGRFCRFRELEHFVATQCNGERSAAEICRRVAIELHREIPQETVEQFLRRLASLSLLESSGGAASARTSGRVRGSLLDLRLRLFDPDQTFGRLVGPLGFVFTGWFLIASVALLLAAALVALVNAEEIRRGLEGAARLEMLLPALLVLALVALLHESAHGLTCKHFGGPVRDIGFLLIYLLPAFYCDVTSAWAFPEKSKRLWVTFAGIWCNLMIWSVTVFVWRTTQTDTWINSASLGPRKNNFYNLTYKWSNCGGSLHPRDRSMRWERCGHSNRYEPAVAPFSATRCVIQLPNVERENPPQQIAARHE